jgi:pimeloyl-ACP methyl ester carboxylesterase
MSVEYIVTIVHGTWARKASWTDESSSLCRGLRDAFPPSSVVFKPFHWSGRNSFSARKKATNGLVTHMKQLIQTWPNARHYIIAHSHGGNIALHALRDNEVNRKVTGIVCLATPFLHARPRDLGPYGAQLLFTTDLLLSIILASVILFIPFFLIHIRPPPAWAFMILLVIVTAVLVWGSVM